MAVTFSEDRLAAAPATPPPFGAIHIARGLGRGPTRLAAFDTALLDAGVANYNLICLSSVIPPGSSIVRRRWQTPPQHYGQRLYVVLSEMREDQPGQHAHAGVAWVQDPEAGHGLFVELHDSDRPRLERDLQATLQTMQHRRGVHLGPVCSEVASVACTDDPVCALVIAVYASQPW
jgi:arginine decarboxylase